VATPFTERAQLIEAASPEHIERVRALFLEYAESLSFSLCFQSFDDELKNLPGNYASPSGRLYLLLHDGRAAGCVALRKLEENICEMKRLYVRPEARGEHLGRRLAESILREAREAGYRRICLDTLPTMAEAQKLYASLGFVPTEPYIFNPVPGTKFLALEL